MYLIDIHALSCMYLCLQVNSVYYLNQGKHVQLINYHPFTLRTLKILSSRFWIHVVSITIHTSPMTTELLLSVTQFPLISCPQHLSSCVWHISFNIKIFNPVYVVDSDFIIFMTTQHSAGIYHTSLQFPQVDGHLDLQMFLLL